MHAPPPHPQLPPPPAHSPRQLTSPRDPGPPPPGRIIPGQHHLPSPRSSPRQSKPFILMIFLIFKQIGTCFDKY